MMVVGFVDTAPPLFKIATIAFFPPLLENLGRQEISLSAPILPFPSFRGAPTTQHVFFSSLKLAFLRDEQFFS